LRLQVRKLKKSLAVAESALSKQHDQLSSSTDTSGEQIRPETDS
jgi:hypothetical protein